ncbi:MAG: twin-arginine translocase subunit TatC [Nocardioidaceae bacterium]|nr:twin-arginine translocase subunit TatC [Nocardioidaceae bacterium]
MALAEHLREFRNRLFISLCAVGVGAVVGWIYYQDLLELLQHPLDATIAQLEREGDVDIRAVINSVAGGFMLQVKVALTAGIVLASPIWLYQLWAFIMPGLHRRERKWTLIFVAIAGPLFASGVMLGYYVLPKGLTVLLGFTPEDVSNLIDVRDYLNFILRILIVFGISFELPLFVVMLNLAGVVRARQLARWRSWIIFATFVFAAVATPSTDPITMLLLAIPMMLLFLISEQIARFVDRRRGLDAEPDYDKFDDEEASPL